MSCVNCTCQHCSGIRLQAQLQQQGAQQRRYSPPDWMLSPEPSLESRIASLEARLDALEASNTNPNPENQ